LGIALIFSGSGSSALAIAFVIASVLFCATTPAALLGFFGASLMLPETGNPGMTLTSLWTIVAGATLITRNLHLIKTFRFGASHAALVVLWAWILLAATVNGDWYLFADITKSIMVATVLYGLIRGNRMSDRKALMVILLGLAAGLTCIAAHFLHYGYVPNARMGYTGDFRLKFVRSDPNASAVYLAVLAAGLWGAAVTQGAVRLARVLLASASIAIAALVPLTFSRAGLAVLAVLTVVGSLFGWRFAAENLKRFPVIVRLLLTTLLAITVAGHTEFGRAVVDRACKMIEIIQQRGLDTRGETFGWALEAISKAPLFGPGFQNFTNDQLSQGLLGKAFAHNTILDMALGGGIIGAALFAVVAIVPVLRVLRGKVSPDLFPAFLMYTVLLTGMQSLSMPSDKLFWSMWLLLVTPPVAHKGRPAIYGNERGLIGLDRKAPTVWCATSAHGSVGPRN
jgi:O-antigen ligase